MLYSARNNPYNVLTTNNSSDKLKLDLYNGFSHINNYDDNVLIEIDSNGLFNKKIGVFNNTYTDCLLQPNGKILFCGYFTQYSGTSSQYIIRLNNDYTIDTGFTIGSSFNFVPFCMALQSDGKILVGGTFTSYSGVTQNYITRLNSNGTIDTGFTIGTGFNNSVNSIAIQPDGKILVGGDFTTYSGVNANRIIRLNSNGTRDTGFTIGSGFNASPYDLYIYSDGKILVGGGFTNYSGVTQNRITKLNSDGTLNTGFTIGSGFDDAIYNIEINTDTNNILVCGNFTSYSGYTINGGWIYLNSDGTIKHNPIIYSNIRDDIKLEKPIYIGNNEFLAYESFSVYNLYSLVKINPELDTNVKNMYVNYENMIFFENNIGKFLKISKYKYLSITDYSSLIYKYANKIYSGYIYNKPNTNIVYVDLNPLIKDIEGSFSGDYILTNTVYYEFENGVNGLINLSNIQPSKYNSYQLNEFGNINHNDAYNRIYSNDTPYNTYYYGKYPLNKFVKYSTNTNRIFNKLIYNEYLSLNEDAFYYPIQQIKISSLYEVILPELYKVTVKYYNYFNNFNDTLTLHTQINSLYNIQRLMNTDNITYNGEKYGAIEFIIDDKSYLYFMEFVCDENDEQLMLFWKNKNDVYDYIPMNKKMVKSIKTNRNSFETNKYNVTEYGLYEERYTTNIYLNESDVLFDLNSDLLSDELYKSLEDIIDSPEIFVAFVGNNILNIKQALLDTDTFTVKRYKNDQMFNFSVRVKLAEKEIRY